MARRFPRHLRRRIVDLRGVWDFRLDGDPPDVMAVPGCWDATPRYAGRRGVGVYRRELLLTDGTPHRLVLDGVQHACRVLLDGEEIGSHDGGFTRFAVDVPRSGVLEVHVDNRDGASPLHRDFYDWHHYGGIARGAELHRLGPAWIDDVRVTTVAVDPVPVVDLAIDLGGGPAPLTVRLGGVELRRDRAGGTVRERLELPGLARWSLREPHLHPLEARFGEDDWRERVGLRVVATDGDRLTINGEPVRLLGVNRHDSHPDHGFALPDDHRLADLQLVERLGANFVRGGHYPQDETFLELCDERGIAVWSEATAWQPDARQLGDESWLRAAERNIDEMVAVARNHPSVVLWGLLNEGRSDDAACRPGYERLIGRLRALDPSRPVTYAGNHTEHDVCEDLVDVVGVNTYPGWYHDEIADVGAVLDRLVAHVDPSKPVIVSEIGAEGVRGWRDAARDRWSEEHQSDLLDAAIRHVLADGSRFTGIAIWVFADFRTSNAMPRVLGRPRNYNQKGVVDEYRRPKLATDTVARAFRASR